MRVAIVLTGHMRCWRQVLPNFKERFEHYNPDVFIHTWNEEGWWIPGDAQNVKGYHENTPKIDYDEIDEAYRPVELKIENWDIYNVIFGARGENYPNFAHRAKNILSMFYKLHQGVSLMNSFSARHGKEYDIVLRMRPDMVFHTPLPLEELNSDTFFTLTHRNHLGQGTGDMLQISNQKNITDFSMLPCYMDSIYEQTGLLCPHVMSKAWIDLQGLAHMEININKTIMHTPKGEYVEMDKWKTE